MGQANFSYSSDDVCDDERSTAVTLSVFADRPHIRDAIGDDALAAGLRLGQTGDLDLFTDRFANVLGDIVVVDCPVVKGVTLAALTRLDMQAENAGAQLIVSTSVEALDSVFGCLDRSRATLLVDPTRGDRVIALARLLTMMPAMRLRELSDDDRIDMLRLTEQVAQIAQRLERMDARGMDEGGSAFRFETPKPGYHAEGPSDGRSMVRSSRPPLPDPRMIRRIIRQRQVRAKFFDGELFADPAWDILLDLTAARAEHLRVSVSSLCIAAGVPPTTALRWISQMVDTGLLVRVEDETDRRRAFIALADKAADAMARYFMELQKSAAELV